MTKLKVLVSIPSAFCFGLQYLSIDLFANATDKIEPHFLITRWNNGEFHKHLVKHGFSASFSWLGMFSRKLDVRNLKMSVHAFIKLPILYWDFIRLVKKLKPDILYFANHHELLLLLPVLWFTRKKVVCHMHDPSPPIPFQIRTFRLYGHRVNHFVAISENVKERLLALGCPAGKISVIRNGVSIPSPSSLSRANLFIERFTWPVDSFIVGITGQMTRTKGHEDLIAAFAIAYRTNNRMRLVIGGQTFEPFYSELNTIIQQCGLKEVVTFSGWMNEVGSFYRNIDLFVLASRHDEGYGLVVAEAMSYGRPAVITASGGATEIVRDGVNGFVVAKRNLEDMSRKILELSLDKELYKSFAVSSRQHIVENFDIRSVADQFAVKLESQR